jgi:hypothetical protein
MAVALITTQTDFIGQNSIPDLDINGANLQWFIVKYEPMFLKELFGAALYASYAEDPATDRFTDTDLLEILKPAIVDYVYYFYMENDSNTKLGTGTGQTKKQNAVTTSPWPKMVRAWNEMTDYCKQLNCYLDDTMNGDGTPVYPEYEEVVLPDWFYCKGCLNADLFYVNGWYPDFDWSYYMVYGVNCIPSIYRLKNRLGI